jgi:hypothetical protein
METQLRLHEALWLVSAVIDEMNEMFAPLIEKGIGIKIRRGKPIYDANQMPSVDGALTSELLDLFAEEVFLDGLPSCDEDSICAVVTYDRGGIRGWLADLLSRKIEKLQGFPCEPFIVYHDTKIGLGGLRGRLVLNREILKKFRGRKVYFLTDLLETESYLIRMAKTARQPRHNLQIVRFASIVKRDRGIRRVVMERIGESLSLFYLIDCQLDPRQSTEDGDVVQHEIDVAFEEQPAS